MPFPTTGIIDDFNRADNADLGANWSIFWANAAMKVVSNACGASAASWFGEYYTAATYGADSEVYVTVPVAAGLDLEIDLRIGGTPGSSPNSYAVVANDGTAGTWRIYRVTAGAGTALGASFTQTVSAGDSIGLEAVGSTITAYYKASAGSWTALANRTDATYGAAGYLAISRIGQLTPVGTYDDFGGGTVVSASAKGPLVGGKLTYGGILRGRLVA